MDIINEDYLSYFDKSEDDNMYYENWYKILERINLYIPRFRNLDLCEKITKYSDKDLNEIYCDMSYRLAESVLVDDLWYIGQQKAIKKYGLKDQFYNKVRHDSNIVLPAFDMCKVHGKKRKELKFELKKFNKRLNKYNEVMSKYSGRTDVICIRARIGGDSQWSFYNCKDIIEKNPNYLEKVEDWDDTTYVSLFFKVSVEDIKFLKNILNFKFNIHFIIESCIGDIVTIRDVDDKVVGICKFDSNKTIGEITIPIPYYDIGYDRRQYSFSSNIAKATDEIIEAETTVSYTTYVTVSDEQDQKVIVKPEHTVFWYGYNKEFENETQCINEERSN